MRTTIEFPDGLVEEAQLLSGLPSKRAVLVAALEEFVRQLHIEHLLSMLGRTDLQLTQEDLERMRAED